MQQMVKEMVAVVWGGRHDHQVDVMFDAKDRVWTNEEERVQADQARMEGCS